MALATNKNLQETNEHAETVAKLSIDQQLQLAAMHFGGTLESKLTAAAVATVVARMVQLNDQDQNDLWACVRDLATIKSQEDAEDTMKTILEILEPQAGEAALVSSSEVDARHSRQNYDSWLVWISEKLRKLREAQNLTQNELAALAGLPQSHISRLEGGRHSPSRKTLEKLAFALKVDVGELTLLT